MDSESSLLGQAVPKGFTAGPKRQCPYPTVTTAIYHHVQAHPESLAAIDLSGPTSRKMTYLELDNKAQDLAWRLRAVGVRPGDRVPLVVKRGLEMLVGIYAILLCGAQYVPLDGGVVSDHTLETVVAQSGGALVVCIEATRHRFDTEKSRTLRRCMLVMVGLENGEISSQPFDLATPDSGCYVIYTSGTTGTPKGVDVTHANVTNLLCLSPGNLGIRPGMKVGQVLNISFDMAAWEILGCLCNGGTLVLRGSDWTLTLSQIDVLICTPSILSDKSPWDFPNISVVATAGERSNQQLADRWASNGAYYNCCGPTETTIVNTMQRHVPRQPLTIGRPTPNNSVYILDEDLKPVKIGEVGVMWAGGKGVSRGYVKLPEKTAERYLPDPFANDGSMMYNTGDLGRWLPSGQINILGRTDDQVKIKGFRVELDGVAHALSSAEGVHNAIALLIDGAIHGFIQPKQSSHGADAESVEFHVSTLLPYYARPSRYHFLQDIPLTPNGKVDKAALRQVAADKDADDLARLARPDTAVAKPQTAAVEPHCTTIKRSFSFTDSIEKEKLSIVSTATTAVAGPTVDFHLDNELPIKDLPKIIRNIIYRAFIPYRFLLALVYLVNIVVLISMYANGINRESIGNMVAVNLLIAVLIRQDNVINALYRIFCSVPKSWPLWIRASCAKVYHLGGVHSSAASWSSFWLLAANLTDAYCSSSGYCPGYLSHSPAYQVLSWMLTAMFASMIAFAWPTFRVKHHDFFERWHRFMGWTMLFFFWVQTFVGIQDTAISNSSTYGATLAQAPAFWMLAVATLSIASSWMWLRKVPVISEVLSDHAIRLHFDYTIPVNGTFTRLSFRPLLEWHSFATVPVPRPHGDPEKQAFPAGYSLVVSNAGDWTRACIQKPPTHVWVRSLPTCGVMRIATNFKRVVIVATGSGIGPLLGHIQDQSCATACLWSTKDPIKTFGHEMVDKIKQMVPDMVIWDTTARGRPDMVKLSYNMARSFEAEAVIIIANQKITKKVVYGLETRGVHAYGAIWDS